MAFGTRVNPFLIREGDEIATQYDPETLKIRKARKVRRAEVCAGKPENVHIDGECYDARFSTVVKKTS